MAQNVNIQKKIIIPILSAVILLLSIFAFLTVRTIRQLERKKVESEALSLIRYNAEEIRGFFVERARIPLTFFQNPFFLDYFNNYNQFRAEVQGDPDFSHIIDSFIQVSSSDSTIKSIFFATNLTNEYFDEEGRYEEEGYFPKNRPWWNRTVSAGKLYCGPPDIDYSDSTVSLTLQMPISHKKDQFLGIGGVDILITTIEEIVKKIKYQNKGEAFLIDDKSRIIYFPEERKELSLSQNLASLDTLFDHTSGFSELSQKMVEQEENIDQLKFRDRHYYVLYTPVHLDKPALKWSLGLFVPKEMIDKPIFLATIRSLIFVVLAIGLISGLTFYITTTIVQPLNALAARLDEMANQKGDLTIALPVETNDAIGLTAKNFNSFVKQIRQLISLVIINAKELAERTTQLHGNSAVIATESQQISNQLCEVAETSRRMMDSVDLISHGIMEIARLSKETSESAAKGEALIQERNVRIKYIGNRMLMVNRDMEGLHRKADGVAETIRFIGDVSEQIGLLAINASIEAEKADEYGKGFAVLAEEIKNLSERTYEANKQGTSLLNEFQNDFKRFHDDISQVRDQMKDEIKSSKKIIDTLNHINLDIKKTDHAVEKMKDQTSEQIRSINFVGENIQQVSVETEKITKGITQSFDEITNVDHRVNELQSLTNQFKVE